MPGITTTDYWDALAWGTSLAETTLTLGTDRLDTRIPPDQYHVSGLQLARMRSLLQSISEYAKGGARWRLLTQSANPFSASESGIYMNASGTLFSVYLGAATSVGGGGGSGAPTSAQYVLITAHTSLTAASALDALSGTVSAIIDDATTSGVTDILRLRHTTSGTPSVGLGAGLLLAAENSAGTAVDLVRISGHVSTTTAGSEASYISFWNKTAGAFAERWRMLSAAGDLIPVTDGGPVIGNATNRIDSIWLQDQGYIYGHDGVGNLLFDSGIGVRLNWGSTSANYILLDGATVLLRGNAIDNATSFVSRIGNTVSLATAGAAWLKADAGNQARYWGLVSGDGTAASSKFKCDGHEYVSDATGITAGAVVMIGNANKTVGTASSTSGLTTWVGVAMTTVTSGVVAQISEKGPVFVNYHGTVNRGDLVQTSGSVAGSVSASGTIAVGALIGKALEAGGVTITGKVLIKQE